MATTVKTVSKNKNKERNMSEQKRIKIVGNAFVLTSTLKFDCIKKLEKLNPNALCLTEQRGEENVEVFRIGTGKAGAVSKYGVTFATQNKDGFATVTVLIPENVDNKKEFIKDAYAKTLFMLHDLEECAKVSEAEIDQIYAQLDNDIEEE